jgi:hypothetical protein
MKAILILATIFSSIVSCADTPPANAPLRHPNRPGVYVISYRRLELLEQYGQGMEQTTNAVERADSHNKGRIWNEAVAAALERYMQANGLVPSECTRGIEVIESGQNEGGGGSAAFRCKSG